MRLLDLAGDRRDLAFERGDALGEVGDRAGRGEAGHGGVGLGRDLRLEGLAGAAGKDLALDRAHLALEPVDARLDRRLRERGAGRRERGRSDRNCHHKTHSHPPGLEKGRHARRYSGHEPAVASPRLIRHSAPEAERGEIEAGEVVGG